MNKTILIAATLLFGSNLLNAQKDKNNPDYKGFYKDVTVQSPEAQLTFENAVSKIEYSKFKMIVKNKTNDYLIYKPSESVFKLGGKTFKPQEKELFIEPLQSDWKTIDIKSDGTNMNTDEFSFEVNGLYSMATPGKVIEAANFALPAKVNDFKVGDKFTCNVTKVVKETKVTEVTFECKYLGTDYGIIRPIKAVVKLENGQEYATSDLKAKTKFLKQGESEKISVEFKIPKGAADMQFANMEIVWKDTFSESKLKALPKQEAKMVLDPGMTAGKNK